MSNNKRDDLDTALPDEQIQETDLDVTAVFEETVPPEAAPHDEKHHEIERAKKHKGLALYLIIMAVGFVLLLVFAYFMQQSQQGLEKNIETLQAEIEGNRQITEQKDKELSEKQKEIESLESEKAETGKYLDALKKLPRLAKLVDDGDMTAARALMNSLDEQGQSALYVEAEKDLFDALVSIISSASVE